jgi:hypothetical protein
MIGGELITLERAQVTGLRHQAMQLGDVALCEFWPMGGQPCWPPAAWTIATRCPAR